MKEDARVTCRRNVLRAMGLAGAAGVVAACGATPQPAATATQAAAPTATTAAPTVGSTATEAAAPTATTATPTATQAAAPSAISEPEKVEFWWYWSPEIHVNAITAAVRKFEENFPNIKVETGPGATGEKITTSFAAGTTPDLLSIWGVSAFASKGVLLPLDDYMSVSKNANNEAFLPVSLDDTIWNGVTYGIPMVEQGPNFFLTMSKEVLDAEGLTRDDLPTTWEQGWEDVQEYSQMDDQGNIKMLWLNLGFADWPSHAGWGPMYGLRAYDKATNRTTFDDPRWAEIFDFAVRFNTVFGVDKIAALFESFPGWSAAPGCALCMGALGGKMDGYWTIGELSKNAPGKAFEYTWIPVPESRKGQKVQVFDGNFGVIPAAAKAPDVAWQLAEYLLTPEAMKIIFEGAGFLTFTKEFLAKPEAVVDFAQWPDDLRFCIDAVSQATEMYGSLSPFDGPIYTAWPAAVDAAVRGQKTIEQALADTQKYCMDEIAKASA